MGQGILIIEDEAILAKNIRIYLERSGYDVRIAGSAEEGLEQLESFRPDVVLLDYQLPGMNGLDLLARLQQTEPGIKVVMLTGQGSVEMAVKAMKLGAVDFLTKPVVLGKLKLMIDAVLGAQRTDKALAYYRERHGEDKGMARLLGESPPMRQLKFTMTRLLDAEAALGDEAPPAVLITGETGTGKEVVARALHVDGPRSSGPFIELNCGSIPAQLLEAELFGHERGAFTDAKEKKLGLVEAADGGTLFLDEIGDMEQALQVKVLKLLEEKTVRRLGSVRDQKVNVRIVAATHQPLERLVTEGRFRSDLYFRLRIVQLSLPALRERGPDILLLARDFLARQSARYGKRDLCFSPEAERAMLAYAWPGNVRELRNVIEQTVLLAGEPVIQSAQLSLCSVLGGGMSNAGGGGVLAGVTTTREVPQLEQVEREMLARALEATNWNVTQAARVLGVSRDTMRYRMEKHRLVRSGETSADRLADAADDGA
jgi:two-component system, NtrC family, response regulator AtoC